MDTGVGTLLTGCLIDTNILIYHLAGLVDDKVESALADTLKSGAYISVITRIELLGWRKHSPASLQAAEVILQYISEIPLSEDIVRLCIRFRQDYPIKLPDAIIAATARHANVSLMTRNTADFEQIADLKLLNPFS